MGKTPVEALKLTLQRLKKQLPLKTSSSNLFKDIYHYYCYNYYYYLFPCSLLTFLFIFLISFNALSIFFSQSQSLPHFTSQLITPSRAKLISHVLYSSTLNEQIPPIRRRNLHQHLFVPHNHSSPQKSRRNPLRILRQTAMSKRFSARANEFFHGSHAPACKFRFFMTWISPVDSFGERELLVIESVFKSHPDACLLIISESLDSDQGIRLLEPFSEAGFHVTAVSPDFNYIFKKTLAQVWFDRLTNGTVDPGEVSLGQNLSNLIRLVVLYKYGGIYIDTDVIVLKSFAGLKNAIGAQTVDVETGKWSRLNNAVLVFDKKHPLLYKFIQEFALTFDGNKWGHNGPYLVSRVVSRVMGRPGFNFTVLPPSAFYPVNWSRIGGLFHGPRPGSHSKWVAEKLWKICNESFAIHLWNKQSGGLKVEEGSVVGRIMSEFCVFCDLGVSTL